MPDWDHQVAQHRPRLTEGEIVKRSCTDKQRYPTEGVAIMRARAFLYRNSVGRTRLWTYPCTHCSGWHLTKRLSGHTLVEV